MKTVCKRATALLMVALLALALSVTAFATSVEDDKDGVLLVRVLLVDTDKGIEVAVQGGSGFLINESTLLTCYHVSHLEEDTAQTLMEAYGYDTLTDLERHLTVRVYYQADLYRTATEITGSESIDFSVLQLNSAIYNHEILQLRTDLVANQESVYALGFPDSVTQVEDATAYSFTASSVTSTPGAVSNNQSTVGGVSFIAHSANITSGSSGGPLVDADGAVVGINRHTDSATESYYWAVSILQVMDVLDTNGITYTSYTAGSESTTTTDNAADDDSETSEAIAVDYTQLNSLISQANAYSEEDYTVESYTALESALTTANSALASSDQTTVDSAVTTLQNAINGLEKAEEEEPESNNNLMFILIIVAVVVVIIIAVVVILLLTRRKKTPPIDQMPMNDGGFTPPPVTPAPGGYNQIPPTDPYNQVPTQAPAAPPTDVLTPGTTVLNQTQETTVLAQPPYAALTRKSNQQKVQISSDSFIIGRDRSSVDFLVEGNSSVGRTHAKIVRNDGAVAVVDMGSVNGTFVNGVKANTNTPVPLKNGDKLTLADEEFTFELL